VSELLYTQEQMLMVRNENYAVGVVDERERIIKVLEDYNAIQNCEWDYYLIEGIDRAIALIKGEQK